MNQKTIFIASAHDNAYETPSSLEREDRGKGWEDVFFFPRTVSTSKTDLVDALVGFLKKQMIEGSDDGTTDVCPWVFDTVDDWGEFTLPEGTIDEHDDRCLPIDTICDAISHLFKKGIREVIKVGVFTVSFEEVRLL